MKRISKTMAFFVMFLMTWQGCLAGQIQIPVPVSGERMGDSILFRFADGCVTLGSLRLEKSWLGAWTLTYTAACDSKFDIRTLSFVARFITAKGESLSSRPWELNCRIPGSANPWVQQSFLNCEIPKSLLPGNQKEIDSVELQLVSATSVEQEDLVNPKQRGKLIAVEADSDPAPKKSNPLTGLAGKKIWFVPNPEFYNRGRFSKDVKFNSYGHGWFEGIGKDYQLNANSRATVLAILSPNWTKLRLEDDTYVFFFSYDSPTVVVSNLAATDEADTYLTGSRTFRDPDHIYQIDPAILIKNRQIAEKERLMLAKKRTEEQAVVDAKLADEEAAARAIQKKKETEKTKRAAAAWKAKGGVQIGMTKGQVVASQWGRPTSINQTHTANGTHEQWVYSLGSYLYFDNGILTAIQN